ncbi:hypothetical protein RvY_05834 [Ramazzottius varieornatus]|uniref:Uncharacterized protein n=1 Tax=Ramazzottius varieornatus TaxID=947166 RepID=A0A1D1V006_RAMVA|nr:hypothetical protein RvY_05834 [Ramazzottius varieornatus]
MTGLQDFIQNYERLEAVKCSFSFPNKPPAQGRYPYYPSCHVRNYTNQYHCFDPQNADRTLNSFITGLWDNDFQFLTYRVPNDEPTQLYKCCKTPAGYYIDYVSCYYMPTHDVYWEYYDSRNHFVTLCSTGYIATGIAKKISPWTGWYNVDWIQCCRLGFGPPVALPPPVTYIGKDQTPVYRAQNGIATRPEIPPGYRGQYRVDPPIRIEFNTSTPLIKNHTVAKAEEEPLHPWSARYKRAKPRDSATPKFKADLRLHKLEL